MSVMNNHSPPLQPPRKWRLDEMVEAFVLNRNEIREIEERHRAELATPLRRKEKLAARMLEVLQAGGQKSARTEFGTVTAVTHDSVSCKEDPDAFIAYIREHDALELLDRRPNKTACKEFLKANGHLPPGVKINSKQDVNVRAINEPEDL